MRKSKLIQIEELHIIAKDLGGKCLFDEYKHSRHKLLWECKKEHQWDAAPVNVKRGTWCPVCARAARSLDIADMHQLANERGGKCLSDTYMGINKKLLWECSEEHQWEAAPNNIKNGTWCPVCSRVARRHTIAYMHDLASGRGGKCLSETYKGVHTKLLWECSEKHQWVAVPGGITNGSWCPKCAGNARYTIEDMQTVAAERGGECLSDTYTNSMTKITWECSAGHQWEAMPMKILSGNWCRKCSRSEQGQS
jgi:hypothetical protein